MGSKETMTKIWKEVKRKNLIPDESKLAVSYNA